jgi:hypothetical protein
MRSGPHRRLFDASLIVIRCDSQANRLDLVDPRVDDVARDADEGRVVRTCALIRRSSSRR